MTDRTNYGISDDPTLPKAGRRLSHRLLPGTILAFALLFKLFYLWSYSTSSPYFHVAHLDSEIYVDWARSINQEGWLGKEVFYQAPFYPYFLSVIFRVFGERFLMIYVIQLLMGMCIIGLIHQIGKRIYGERAGLISALICVTYAPFTFFETKILTTVTEMLLGLLCMFFWTRAEQEERRGYWMAGAIALGLAITCRPNYILVVPLMVMVLLLRHRRSIHEMIFPLVAVCLIPGLFVGAVTVRNYLVGRDFVAISASAGVTFAQGNNPMARGAMVVLPGFSSSAMNQRHEDTRIAEREAGRTLKPSEISAFWFRWAFSTIREHPLQYLRLLLDKTLLIFNNRELGNNHLMSIDKELVPSLKLAFVPFGLIMAWALVGFLPIIRPGPPASVLIATSFGAVLTLLAFYVCTRFRMTLAPAAIIMAGGGVQYLLNNLRNVKRTVLIVIVLVAVCILSLPLFMPLSKTQLQSRDAKYWANIGAAFVETSQLEKALWAYDRAIRMDPERYDNYLKKTGLLIGLRSGKNDVIIWARYAAGRFPHEHSAHVLLGDALRARGKNDEAIVSYQKALSLRSDDVEACLRLGELLSARGSFQQGQAVLAQGLKAAPDDIRLQYTYAVACFHLGNRGEALKWLQQVVSKDADYAQSRWFLQQLEN